MVFSNLCSRSWGLKFLWKRTKKNPSLDLSLVIFPTKSLESHVKKKIIFVFVASVMVAASFELLASLVLLPLLNRPPAISVAADGIKSLLLFLKIESTEVQVGKVDDQLASEPNKSQGTTSQKEAAQGQSLPKTAQMHWQHFSHLDRGSLPSYANHPWAKRWKDNIAPLRYYPFSLWRVEANIKSEFINTTGRGMRQTPSVSSCSNYSGKHIERQPKHIFFFGGSTMFGDGWLRDEDLIPFQFSCEAAKDSITVLADNYGQSGYNLDNDLVTFAQELMQGRIPDIAIFYYGFNDVAHKVFQQVKHMRQHDFQALFLKPGEKPKNHLRLPSVHEINVRSRDIALELQSKIRYLKALANEYDVKVIVALQPTLFSVPGLDPTDQKLLSRMKTQFPSLFMSFTHSYSSLEELRLTQGDELLSKVKFYSLANCFRTKRQRFVDIVHLSPLGNQQVATCLYNKVKKDL